MIRAAKRYMGSFFFFVISLFIPSIPSVLKSVIGAEHFTNYFGIPLYLILFVAEIVVLYVSVEKLISALDQ